MQRFYFVLFLAFFIPLTAFGQVPSTLENIEVIMNPENPAPNQQVNIKLESYSIDLDRASIVWSVDGKTVQSGTGLVTLTTKAPVNGKNSVVIASIKTLNGAELRQTINIRPGDVSITWEAVGYTPPLFKGKTLPSYQGSTRFVAMPELYKNGVRLNPNDLVYTWKKGSTVLGNASGYGRQSVVVAGGAVPEPMTIRVDVQSKDGLTRGAGIITVDFYDPEIQFYKEDPLYGVLYNKALVGQEPLTNNEFEIVSVPFNFSNIGKYNWSINNTPYPDLSDQRSITFRNNGTAQGSSLISLELKSATNILQFARQNFTVYFNKQEN